MDSDPVWQAGQDEKSSHAAEPKGGKNFPPKITTIKKRKDFLAARIGKKAFSPNLIVQIRFRNDGNQNVRTGFVASKKTGNAVQRNRAKRRMRALVNEILPQFAQKGTDYVFIAHASLLTQEYKILKLGLHKILKKLKKNTEVKNK